MQHACLLQLQGCVKLQPCLDLSSYEKQAMFVRAWNVISLLTFTNTCHQFGSAWYLLIRRLVRSLCCFDIVNVCPAIRTCTRPYLARGVVGFAFSWSLNPSRRTRNLDGELRNLTAIIFLLVAWLERGFALLDNSGAAVFRRPTASVTQVRLCWWDHDLNGHCLRGTRSVSLPHCNTKLSSKFTQRHVTLHD